MVKMTQNNGCDGDNSGVPVFTTLLTMSPAGNMDPHLLGKIALARFLELPLRNFHHVVAKTEASIEEAGLGGLVSIGNLPGGYLAVDAAWIASPLPIEPIGQVDEIDGQFDCAAIGKAPSGSTGSMKRGCMTSCRGRISRRVRLVSCAGCASSTAATGSLKRSCKRSLPRKVPSNTV